MIRFVALRFARLVGATLAAAILIYAVTAFAPTQTAQPGFFGWLAGALIGNFGLSSVQNLPAGDLVADGLDVTLPLLLLVLLLTAALGVGFGWLAARRPGALADRLLIGACDVAAALPGFWLGLLLVLLFALTLRWLPSGGFVPWFNNFGSALASLVLPALSVAVPFGAMLVRATRDALVAAKASGYVRGAMARGLTAERAWREHGLSNAGQALLGAAAGLLPQLIVATLIVETVFYLPGLGRLFTEAAGGHDVAVARALAFVVVLLIAIATFVVDLGKAWADPRVQDGRPA